MVLNRSLFTTRYYKKKKKPSCDLKTHCQSPWRINNGFTGAMISYYNYYYYHVSLIYVFHCDNNYCHNIISLYGTEKKNNTIIINYVSRAGTVSSIRWLQRSAENNRWKCQRWRNVVFRRVPLFLTDILFFDNFFLPTYAWNTGQSSGPERLKERGEDS